jgi:hypothetical protein
VAVAVVEAAVVEAVVVEAAVVEAVVAEAVVAEAVVVEAVVVEEAASRRHRCWGPDPPASGRHHCRFHTQRGSQPATRLHTGPRGRANGCLVGW